MPRSYESIQERIIAMSVIVPNTLFNGSPCWMWMGARSGNGRYGKVNVRSKRLGERRRKGKWVNVRKVKSKLAHRMSREAFKNEVFRRGNYGRHLCPPSDHRTLCCNPDHTSQGSPRQNNRDTVREGRHRNGSSA